MVTKEDHVDGSVQSRRKRRGRILLLVGVLAALSFGLVVNSLTSNLSGRGGDRTHTKEEIAEYEARVLPSQDAILKFLEGQAILPTDVEDAVGEEAKPLILRRDAMEAVAIRREGYYFTLVTFTLKGDDRGSYAVEIVINHNPSDGTFAFNSFRVQKASRR